MSKPTVMRPDRRRFLARVGALGAAAGVAGAPLVARAVPELLPRPSGRRVVIVGGGWGGLSAARHLRELAPELDVVVLERNAAFWSGPLSNRWLANLVDGRYLSHEYGAAAKAYGYTFVRAEVTDIDRDRRRVVTAGGTLDYDWLVLAAGIRYDYGAWFGDDRRAADHSLRTYPGAFQAAEEAVALRQKLERFAGGDLVMTIPPMPYRCPPAPYERAALIGWLIKSRRIKGRLIVLDPNAIAPGFRRILAERYLDQITYVGDARIRSVDPFNRRIATDLDELRFDDAILMAPQQAGDVIWKAGLIGRNGDGQPTGWADQDPLRLHARADDRIFLIGDAMGTVSPLFGQYPKSGHMASRQGRVVAQEIAARAREKEVLPLLPESVCYVYTDFDPMEVLRIDTRYRIRGDGLIEQTVKQVPDRNPRDEDVQWAKSRFGELLAFGG